MYAHCVHCLMTLDGDADQTEAWAVLHESGPGKHSVKIEGYEQVSADE